MKLKTSTLIWTFVWCIFMGITVGSIGIGAIIPNANLVAKPFVCPTGQMKNSSDYYQVSPVESVTTITWYCVDPKTGTKTELGIFPMSLYAGAFYGLVFFLVVFIGMVIRSYRQAIQNTTASAHNEAHAFADPELEELNRLGKKSRPATDAMSRMKELKALRASNSITAAEYEQKRAEILKDL